MSMAVKYGMKKRMKDGGQVTSTSTVDTEAGKKVSDSFKHIFGKGKRDDDTPDESAPVAGGYAEGGCVHCGAPKSGIVDSIMRKRMSEGGQVANDTDMTADTLPNEFDDLVLRDELDSSYTGANSGDELGNDALDDREHDLVARIMRSRAKKSS